LERGSIKRKEWVLDRMRNIKQTVKDVINKGEEEEIVDGELEM